MEALISIIVPVYNVERYIYKCIDSLVNQTYKNIEIILVDDGSTDNSGKICDEYSQKDNRIKVIHQCNKGVGEARNTGLKAAVGDYIGFVDPDDFVDYKMYELLYTDIVESKSEIAVCSSYRIDLDGKKSVDFQIGKSKIIFMDNDILIMVLKGKLSSRLTDKLIKKSLFDGIYFSDKRIGEDVEIMLRLFYKTRALIYNPMTLYYYIKRGDSITEHTKNFYDEKREQILALHISKFYFLKQNKPELLVYYIDNFVKSLISMYENLMFENDYKHLKGKIVEEIYFNKKILEKHTLTGSKKIKFWSFLNCPNLFKFIVLYEKYVGGLEKKIRKILKSRK